MVRNMHGWYTCSKHYNGLQCHAFLEYSPDAISEDHA